MGWSEPGVSYPTLHGQGVPGVIRARRGKQVTWGGFKTPPGRFSQADRFRDGAKTPKKKKNKTLL